MKTVLFSQIFTIFIRCFPYMIQNCSVVFKSRQKKIAVSSIQSELRKRAIFVLFFVALLFEQRISAMSLEDVVSDCLERNLTIKEVQYAQEASKEEFFQACGKFAPNLKTNAYWSRSEGGSAKMRSKAGVDQDIFNLPNFHEIKAKRLSWQVKKIATQAKIQATLYSVIEAYFNTITAAWQQDINRQSLIDIEKKMLQTPHDEALKAQFFTLLGNQQEYALSLQTHLRKLEQLIEKPQQLDPRLLIQEVQEYDVMQILDIKNFSNYCDRCFEEGIDNLSFQKAWVPDSLRQALILQAQENSYNCMQAQLDYFKLRAEYKGAQAAVCPTLSAAVDWANSSNPHHPFDSSYSWKAELTLSWSFLDGAKKYYKIKAAKYKALEKHAKWLQTCSELQKGVDLSLSRLQHNYLRWLSAKLARISAVKRLEKVHKNETNEANTLESLDYRDALLQDQSAKVNYIKTSFNLALAYYKLALELGYNLQDLISFPQQPFIWQFDENNDEQLCQFQESENGR